MEISIVQKAAIELAISMNPVQVVIKRVEETIHDGAIKRSETVLPAQTMLIYPSDNRIKTTHDAGMVQDINEWNGLAPSTADVQWGSSTNDLCTIENIGTLELVSGRPLMIGNVTNGYQLRFRMVR